MCGEKWADDEGGKPEFKWPAEILLAEAVLATNSPDDALKEYGAKLVESIAEDIEGLSVHVFDHINKLADKIRKGEFK